MPLTRKQGELLDIIKNRYPKFKKAMDMVKAMNEEQSGGLEGILESLQKGESLKQEKTKRLGEIKREIKRDLDVESGKGYNLVERQYEENTAALDNLSSVLKLNDGTQKGIDKIAKLMDSYNQLLAKHDLERKKYNKDKDQEFALLPKSGISEAQDEETRSLQSVEEKPYTRDEMLSDIKETHDLTNQGHSMDRSRLRALEKKLTMDIVKIEQKIAEIENDTKKSLSELMKPGSLSRPREGLRKKMDDLAHWGRSKLDRKYKTRQMLYNLENDKGKEIKHRLSNLVSQQKTKFFDQEVGEGLSNSTRSVPLLAQSPPPLPPRSRVIVTADDLLKSQGLSVTSPLTHTGNVNKVTRI